MDLSTRINIVVTRLNQLTKVTKALEKVNITNKRIIEKFEQMDGSSRKLAENLSEANKSADKLARGALSKLTKELQEIERSSSRVNLNIGGLLSKLGAARAFAGKGLGNIFGKGFLGLTEGAGAARGLSDIAKLFGKKGAGFSNLARGISDATFSFTGLQAAAVATQKALNFVSPVASAIGSFITLERSAKNMTENIINSFRNMNRKIVFDSLQSFKQFGFMYDPRSALNMDIWKNFEDMKGGGFAGMKGIQSQGKAALGGMFAPQIGRGWYGGTTFPNRAQGLRNLSQIGLPLQAIQMSGVDTSLMGFPKDEVAYIEQLRENIQLGKDVNRENFRRKKTLEEVLRVENRIENQIRKNLALSKQARKASGFRDWNAYIGRGGQALLSPVEKSIRRHGRKVGHGFTADQYGPQPLYGPAMAPKTPSANTLQPTMSWWNRAGFGKNANPKGAFANSRGMGGRMSGALSSGMIGGGFPLLFGQGGLGALGGGIGGVLGGALGGGWGFGLSIVGTALASAAQDAITFQKSIDKVNNSIRQTGSESLLTAKGIKNLATRLDMTKEEVLAASAAFAQFNGESRLALTSTFGEDPESFYGLAEANDAVKILEQINKLRKKENGLNDEKARQVLEILNTEGAIAARIELRNRSEERLIELENLRKVKNNDIMRSIIAASGPESIRNEKADPLYYGRERVRLKKLEWEATDKLLEKEREWIKLQEHALFMAQIRAEVQRLMDPMSQLRELTVAVGASFAESFKGVIKGTMSVQEAFANMFNRIADHFADMAAKMAANKLMLGILQAFVPGSLAADRAFSGLGSGSALNTPANLDLPKGAEGAYWSGGLKTFASGGMATRPTLGLVGEAGEDEYIIPASKMAASMQRYSAGARGEAVIPGTGSSYAGGGAGGSTTVNYSGPILNFNSEEFVPKSAVGQIIASAAKQGASMGETRTMKSMQNNRSARARIGM